MPHQQYMADVALEIDNDTGLLAYGLVVIVIERQQGKTEWLFPMMTHRCLGFSQAGPQRVMYTTQTADKAREKWRDIHVARLDKSPFSSLYTTRLQRNSEAIMWANGSMWGPGSTTGKTGGTGDTLDLGVIDEGWSRPDNRTELGMRPAMLTRPWKQLIVASMVPGLSRAQPGEWPYLERLMRMGRARVEAGIRTGVCYIEYSAEEGLDPGDPATWWSCMPGLAYGLITEKNVRDDFEAWSGQGRLIDFEAEYLGWAPMTNKPLWRVISEATWGGLLDPYAGATQPMALGVESTEERSVTSIAAACRRPDGDIFVELVDRRPGVDWAVARIVELYERWEACGLGINPAGPASSLIVPLEKAAREAGITMNIHKPNQREYAGECGRFYDATGELEPVTTGPHLVHRGQSELTDAVAGSAKHVFGTGGLWMWDLDVAGVDVSPVPACTVAIGAGDYMDWAGGDYDVMATLGRTDVAPPEADPRSAMKIFDS